MNQTILLQPILTLHEMKVLHIFFDEQQGLDISDELNLSKKETARIINRIKLNWNVKSEVGLIKESLKRGYYDPSSKMDFANLYHWAENTEMSYSLRIAINRYLNWKDIQAITVGNVSAIEFMAVEGVNLDLWTEFDDLRITSSKKITSFNTSMKQA